MKQVQIEAAGCMEALVRCEDGTMLAQIDAAGDGRLLLRRYDSRGHVVGLETRDSQLAWPESLTELLGNLGWQAVGSPA